jgi:hypothetical protein
MSLSNYDLSTDCQQQTVNSLREDIIQAKESINDAIHSESDFELGDHGICSRFNAYNLMWELPPNDVYYRGISPGGELCPTRLTMICLIDTLTVDELLEMCTKPPL